MGNDRRQVQEDGSVGQVAATHEVFDPIEDHRALGVDDAPLVVGEQRAGRETASEHELAEAVRQPVGYHADVVVRQEPAVDGGGHQVAGALGLDQERGGLRVDQEPEDSGQGALGRPLLAVDRQDRIGTDRPERRRQPGDQEAKIALWRG